MFDENNTVSLFQTPLEKADVVLRFEGRALSFSHPICRYVNRYFVPLLEFVEYLNGIVQMKGQMVNLLFKNKAPIMIDSEDKTFAIYNNELYLSLFDLCRVLNLKSRWDYNIRSIALYFNENSAIAPKPIPIKRPALIRLEDVTAGNWYLSSPNLEKMRVVADFMFSLGILFHIAWISRFIDPPNNIDNDISRNYSIENAHFLFTMDYMLSKNGLIGLHGYTHQYYDETSGDGTEFSEDRVTDEASIRQRIEAAIDIANRLKFPFQFFETPHYAATAYQQSVFETYFDIIYEGFVGIWGEKIVRSPRNHRTLYIPTPLGYVEGDNGLEELLERIENLSDDSLESLFYHPFMEFDSISLYSGDNGYPLDSYSKNSPLHQITKAMVDKGCQFTKITDPILVENLS